MANAQTFPSRPVRLVVPFPPGGPTDAFARFIAAIVRMPEMTERMLQFGMDPVVSTPGQFEAFVRREMEKWAPVVKATGATAD